MIEYFPRLYKPIQFPLRWGIIGLGRAGKSKLKALNTLGTDLALIQATASRRGSIEQVYSNEFLNSLSSQHPCYEWSVDEILTSSDIDAVAICSENELHASQTHSALMAGKHVLVDFPLCTHQDQIQSLYDLSQSKNCLLHLEIIGLLTPKFKLWAAHHQKDPICKWESIFNGGSYRWIQDEIKAQRCVHLAFSRLYQLYTLFDSLELQDVQFQQNSLNEYSLKLSFDAFLSNQSILPPSQILLNETRGPGLKRSLTQRAYTHSGTSLHTLSVPPLKDSLFVQDLMLFYQCLNKNTSTLNLNHLLKTYKMIHFIEDQII